MENSEEFLYRSKKEKFGEQLYFFALLINLIYYTLANSAINVVSSTAPENLVLVGSVILVSMKLLLTDNTKPIEVLIFSGLFILGILIYYFSKDKSIFSIMILMFGAKNVEFKSIIKLYIYVLLTISITLFLLSHFNVINNFQYFRDDGTIRNSFGFGQPTLLAGTLFCILGSLFVLVKNKNKFVYTFFCIVIAILIEKITNARNDVVMIFLLSIAVWFTNPNKKIGKAIFKSLPYFFLAIPILVVFLSRNYHSGMDWINNILSNRLALGNQAFFQYTVKPFGQYIAQIGNGGGRTSLYTFNYFYIDSSYVQLLLANGLIVFVCFLAAYFLFIKKAVANSFFNIAIIILIFLLQGSWERSFFNVALNPYLLIFMANFKNMEFDSKQKSNKSQN